MVAMWLILASEKRQNFYMVASRSCYNRDSLCAFGFFLIPSFFLLAGMRTWWLELRWLLGP